MSAIRADSSTRMRANSIVSVESPRARAIVPPELESMARNESTSARIPATIGKRVESFLNLPTFPLPVVSNALIESLTESIRPSLA